MGSIFYARTGSECQRILYNLGCDNETEAAELRARFLSDGNISYRGQSIRTPEWRFQL